MPYIFWVLLGAFLIFSPIFYLLLGVTDPTDRRA